MEDLSPRFPGPKGEGGPRVETALGSATNPGRMRAGELIPISRARIYIGRWLAESGGSEPNSTCSELLTFAIHKSKQNRQADRRFPRHPAISGKVSVFESIFALRTHRREPSGGPGFLGKWHF